MRPINAALDVPAADENPKLEDAGILDFMIDIPTTPSCISVDNLVRLFDTFGF